MRNTMIVAAALAFSATAAATTMRASKVGPPAPDFKGTDTKGTIHALSDFKGKWVVLEWHNEGCPYVRKHYGGHNMQKLQQEWTAKGVVWLTIISSAPGQQGYMTAADADEYFARPRRRLCCSTRRARSGASTMRRPRRTCSSSTRTGC
jgi:hypothetical protein